LKARGEEADAAADDRQADSSSGRQWRMTMYILRQIDRYSRYEFFVRFGHLINPDLPCGLYKKHREKGYCRCRWHGDGVVRGTRKEATVYPTLRAAKDALKQRTPFCPLSVSFKIVKR